MDLDEIRKWLSIVDVLRTDYYDDLISSYAAIPNKFAAYNAEMIKERRYFRGTWKSGRDKRVDMTAPNKP